MLVVRTRSSRLFLVVLHLVCVSTHLRVSNSIFLFWKEAAATIPVHAAISVISPTESSNPSEHDLNKMEPYWLQDANDEKCFGPMGLFSECGDANLWKVIPKFKRHARRRQFIRWATEDDGVDPKALQGYFALQVFDQYVCKCLKQSMAMAC